MSAQNSAAGDQLSVTSAQYALADAQRAQAAGPAAGDTDPNAAGKLALATQQAQLAYTEAQQRAAQSGEDIARTQVASRVMARLALDFNDRPRSLGRLNTDKPARSTAVGLSPKYQPRI